MGKKRILSFLLVLVLVFGNMSLAFAETDVEITISGQTTAPALDHLVIEGDSLIEISENGNGPFSKDYTVKAYDSENKEIVYTSDSYYWIIKDTPTGVTLSEKSLIITDQASSGDIILEIYNDADSSKVETKTITLQDPGTDNVLKALEVAGKDELNIPTK